MTADWAQVLVGIVGLGLVGGTLYYAHKAWKAAEAANRQTRELFLIERRAWCAARFGALSAQMWGGGGATVKARLTLDNIGQSPAFNVKLCIYAWYPEVQEVALSEAIAKSRRAKLEQGRIVFPGKAEEFEVKWETRTSVFGTSEGAIYLHGWFSYRTSGDNDLHITPFIVRHPYVINHAGSFHARPPEQCAVTLLPD